MYKEIPQLKLEHRSMFEFIFALTVIFFFFAMCINVFNQDCELWVVITFIEIDRDRLIPNSLLNFF